MVDLTKMQSRFYGPGDQRIAVCPLCKRTGAHKQYKSGGATFVHTARFQVIGGVRWVVPVERCTTTVTARRHGHASR